MSSCLLLLIFLTLAGIALASVAPLALDAEFDWAIPEVRTALLSWLGDANLVWLILAAFAILGVLGTASTALSTRLYAQRDL